MTNREAIDIIKVAISEIEWEYPLEYAIAFEKAIEALKQAEWILFTFDEDGLNCRLPNEDEEILVSSKYGVWIDTFMRDEHGYYLDSERDFKGLAWMPLPEPYKED